MRSAQFELISLSLAFAISLSLPRVLGILLSLQMSNVAVPFATMISSAVLISSFGLAFAEYGPVSGVMITLLGVLISRAARISEAPLVTFQAAIFLVIYMQARFAAT